MISQFAQYLTDMQKIAHKSNILIEARHFDVLHYYFKSKKSPSEATDEYFKFRRRIYALENQELPLKRILTPLKEMSIENFKKIFHSEGFSVSLITDTIASFSSLYGFHKAISQIGKFESYRIAYSLGYDLEFTLPNSVDHR